MFRPDALFLDIDGTILKSDHTLSARMKNAIRAIRDSGTLVCLASGRSWEALKSIYLQLGLKGPTVCFNGALIIEGPGGTPVYEANLSDEVSQAAISEFRSSGIEFVAFHESRLYYEIPGHFAEGYYERTGLSGTQVNFDQMQQMTFTKVLFISEREKLQRVRQQLESKFDPESISVMFSETNYLEVMAGGVNKGNGLLSICDIHGINPEKTVAMGDGWNDVDLFRAAGEFWVMGNAPEELKSQFPDHMVAPDSDSEGAARVIEAIMEGREPDFA